MAEVGDERRHEFGLQLVAERAEQVLGHASEREGSDRVGLDVVLGAFDGEHVGEADEAHLRSAVVGLAEVPEDAGCGRGRDDAAVALLAHDLPRRSGHVECAAQVDVEDRVDQVGAHVVERLVAQDAGIVDDDVDRAERVDGGLDDRLATLWGSDRVGVGDCFASGGLDLVHHELGGALVRARTVDRAAEVVDDDERTACRHHQRVLPAEAATRTSDDGHLAVETQIRRCVSHGSRSYRWVRPGRKPAW